MYVYSFEAGAQPVVQRCSDLIHTVLGFLRLCNMSILISSAFLVSRKAILAQVHFWSQEKIEVRCGPPRIVGMSL